MKILCICNHGNVRSACMARELKDTNGPCEPESPETMLEYVREWAKVEAIAVGAHVTKFETMKLLCGWADKVVDMSDEIPEVNQFIKNLAGEKYVRFFVGGDRWHNAFHPELRTICQHKREELLK